MSIEYPSFETLVQIARAEMRNQLPEVDPAVFGSFVRALLDSNAAANAAVVQTVRDLERQAFPQTAQGEFLDVWAGYEGLERRAATASSGKVVFAGAASTFIPLGTELTSSTGVPFKTTAVGTVVQTDITISSLTRVGLTVTAETVADHNLATGQSVTIFGADQSEYNGTFTIVAIDRDTFSYVITGLPSTPATGSVIYAQATFVNVPVRAETPGAAGNIASGGSMTLNTAITGLTSSIALVDAEAVTGGADIENDADLRERVLLSRSILEGVFTPDQITLAALSVAGNTRVFVVRPSNGVAVTPVDGFVPAPGQTAIYILRDDDDNILPNTATLAQTKEAIIAQAGLPANTAIDDVFVSAPTLVPIDILFASITPDTPTMRTAIGAQLAAFFTDSAQFETDIPLRDIECAVQGTRDEQTGQVLAAFTINAPVGNTTIGNGEIATLGDVTYAVVA